MPQRPILANECYWDFAFLGSDCPKPAPDAPVASVATPASTGRSLSISEFAERCEGLTKSKETWDKKTAQNVRVVVETFEGIPREHNVRDTSEIEQFHLGKLRDHFDEIPSTSPAGNQG